MEIMEKREKRIINEENPINISIYNILTQFVTFSPKRLYINI